MDTLFTPNFFIQYGAMGVFLFLSVKGINKLYADIREDSKQREEESKSREEKLMKYLDKKSETDKQVADTLENMHNRICEIECLVKK